MTVAELVGLLASQDQSARVFVFDENRDGIQTTVEINCVLSMTHHALRAVILNHDADEAERLAALQSEAAA